MRKRRGKETRGRDEPKGRHLVDIATKIYNVGQPVDEQTMRKRKLSSVEESERPRPNRQEPRNENRRENVHWEESLNVQDEQRRRRERAGGAGQ